MSLFDDLPEPSARSDPVDSNQHENNLEPSKCDRFERPCSICAFIMKGERPEMQDAHVCINDLSAYFRTPAVAEVCRLSYFAVFDGHGGSKASTFAAKRLHLNFASKFPKGGLAQIEKDIKRVFYDAFKKTDGDFLREACQQRPHWRDGSTASVVLLVNNTLYIANLGDSKVVLAREVEETIDVDSTKSTAGSGSPKSALISAVSLTRDHNPMDYEERQRIQATGATVQNGRVNNILEVSRSFGDYQFKKQGVTCLPDVRKCQLTAHDRFVLIACDGLWKSFPPEEAVALTNRLLMKELESAAVAFTGSKTNSPSSTAGLTQRHLDSVCSHLVNEAVLRMSGDNVTCILLAFPTAFVSHNVNANTDGNGYQTQDSAHLLSSHISVLEPPTKVSKLT
ncbi:hypothetical protein AHF37_03036 [Paragonimus kellicotti]|nr:hypothetical protein AHF37_03036 [Paragonimus kellicotti]